MEIVLRRGEPNKLYIDNEFECIVMNDIPVGKYGIFPIDDPENFYLYTDKYPKWHDYMIHIDNIGTLCNTSVPISQGVVVCKYIKDNKPVYSASAYKHLYETLLGSNEPLFLSVI